MKTCVRCGSEFMQNVKDPRLVCLPCQALKSRERRAARSPGRLVLSWRSRARAIMGMGKSQNVVRICAYCKEATLRAHPKCQRVMRLEESRLRYRTDEQFRQYLRNYQLARRKTLSMVGTSRACKQCGEAFIYVFSARRSVFCSQSCSDRWSKQVERLKRRGPGSGSHNEMNPGRRRRIAARDGWICHLCSAPVDPALAHPHPLSASLDHLRPRSVGGSHRRDNLKLAHLKCNEERGDLELLEYQAKRIGGVMLLNALREQRQVFW